MILNINLRKHFPRVNLRKRAEAGKDKTVKNE